MGSDAGVEVTAAPCSQRHNTMEFRLGRLSSSGDELHENPLSLLASSAAAAAQMPSVEEEDRFKKEMIE